MTAAAFNDADRRAQYALQLVQVFFVGMTLGMVRTVIPAVAESDFGVRQGDVAMIVMFVLAFGVVKGAMNLIAGACSERFGRRRVLIIGWVVALPIPWMIWSAPTAVNVGGGAFSGWWNIVAATALLGVNQGLTWSMTLTSKLDLTRPERRGLTNGLNEFSGYVAVAFAGVATAMLADRLGARTALLWFGYATIVPALALAAALVRETRAQAVGHDASTALPTSSVFMLALRDRRFFALCQCGLVEKFIDVLAWIALPLLLVQRGVELRHVGWVPGVYATTWGALQIVTGALSDRIGRRVLIVGGMLTCGCGVIALPMREHVLWGGAWAAIVGAGMAMLYPTLGAAVADHAPPAWRGTALGVYRFWRDLGYAVGAAAIGALALLGLDMPYIFLVIGCAVVASGILTGVLMPGGTPRSA